MTFREWFRHIFLSADLRYASLLTRTVSDPYGCVIELKELQEQSLPAEINHRKVKKGGNNQKPKQRDPTFLH